MNIQKVIAIATKMFMSQLGLSSLMWLSDTLTAHEYRTIQCFLSAVDSTLGLINVFRFQEQLTEGLVVCGI